MKPFDGQGAGHAVDEREHVGGEVLLQAGALVEVVEDDLGDGVTLEDDDEALAGTTGGFVADVGDAADCSVAHELGDLVGEVVGVDLVGQLGDDEALAALDFLNVHDGALGDGAAAGAVGVFDALAAQDGGAGWGSQGRVLAVVGPQVALHVKRQGALAATVRRRPLPAGCAGECGWPYPPQYPQSR